MTVYLIDGRALVEQQEQWTTDRRFIFLFPSSRASRSCRAPREISRSPRLAHKAPVMQTNIKEAQKAAKLQNKTIFFKSALLTVSTNAFNSASFPRYRAPTNSVAINLLYPPS